MRQLHRRFLSIYLLGLLLLSGCAMLRPDYENPTMRLDSISLGKASGINQEFILGLAINNPNSQSIPVRGMSYTVSVNGFKLISGSTNQIDSLKPYADTPVSVSASTNLLEGIRLINSFTSGDNSLIKYQLSAKLDLAGWPFPLQIVESGELPFTK